MNYPKVVLLFFTLAVIADFTKCAEESSNTIQNATKVNSRSGRKDYAIYSPPDTYASQKTPTPTYYVPESAYKEEEEGTFEADINSRLSEDDKAPPSSPPVYSPATYDDYVPVGFYKPPLPPRPPRYYSPKGGMYKSGSNVNWNVWKGDQPDSTDTSSVIDNSKGGPPPDFDSYYFPTGVYKGDPWTPTPDQMSAMMMMMNQMQAPPKPKFGGFLAKLTQEPIALLLAAILPFTILLAAVLPTLVNMMMNGGLPIVTTTATGNNGRSLDGAEFLKPVIEAINTFGARSFDSPDCMQKIFCQVTKGPAGNGTESRSFQKALYRVSTLVDKRWLDTFGVKTLFDSMQDGNCEKIPCSERKPAPRANQSKTGKEKNVHNSKS